MGFAVRANGWDDPLALSKRVTDILRGKAAEAVGLYLVAQVAYSHEVQGRDEDDKHNVWPERKVASTGLIVFGERSAVKAAIKEALSDPTKQQFEIARAKNAPADAVRLFGRRQVLGASLALEQEQLRTKAQKELGMGSERARQEARRSAWKAFRFAVAGGDTEAALVAHKLWRSAHRKITKAGSYARTASYLPRPVLLRTGTLRDSWTFRVETVGNKVVLWVGTTVPYARAHELGSPKRNLPVRQQVVVSNMDRAHIRGIVGDILNEELNRG